jgi:hypothetical protein
MIENERELEAAQKWIEYWKSTRTTGQSWLGNEQASQKIAELKREILAYRRSRAGNVPADTGADQNEKAPAGLPA